MCIRDRIYMVLSAVSYPFLAIYNSCAALFRSMGNSKISMEASIVMNIINVIGNADVYKRQVNYISNSHIL